MNIFSRLKRNALLTNFIFLSIGFFSEIVGFSFIFSVIPESHREQIGNICVIVVICVTAYIKLRPNKMATLMTDLLTIVLACVVTLPMMKSDDSFFNITNIILTIFSVFFMAYCSSKEILKERYSIFKKYMQGEYSSHFNQFDSYSKFLRSNNEIPKKYVSIIDKKLQEPESYKMYTSVQVENRNDYKKLLDNYYYFYLFYKEKGYGFWLKVDKNKKYQIKIDWILRD